MGFSSLAHKCSNRSQRITDHSFDAVPTMLVFHLFTQLDIFRLLHCLKAPEENLFHNMIVYEVSKYLRCNESPVRALLVSLVIVFHV